MIKLCLCLVALLSGCGYTMNLGLNVSATPDVANLKSSYSVETEEKSEQAIIETNIPFIN